MINEITETIGRKSINQYMIIEDRYLTLKRYLRLMIKENRLDISNVECILDALDDEPIEEVKEVGE